MRQYHSSLKKDLIPLAGTHIHHPNLFEDQSARNLEREHSQALDEPAGRNETSKKEELETFD